jgi:hypothetical protein
MIRAALVLTAGGVIGFVGACKSDSTVAPPPPPPPPPPPTMKAPIGLTATPVSATQINLTWMDSTTNETGFRVERCSGAGCTTFAQVGTDLAANTTSYSDIGLTAATSYSYRVRAFNATDISAWTATVPATTLSASAAFTLVGAGEITTCASSAGPLATAHLVDSILKGDANAVAFTVGNNLADMTAGTTFQTCFDPKWGSFKSKTYFAIGNGDFGTDRGPTGVYGYIDNTTAAGDKEIAHKGWFSFDKGSWHIVVLNTSDWEHGGPATFGIDAALTPQPSEQVDWLAADLQANTQPCVAVISWERRFYTTGAGALGRQSNMLPMSTIMYQNGVDLLISAKDKAYERFAPMNPTTGTADAVRGLRQFIVGTGGRSNDQVPAGSPENREAVIGRLATGDPDQWGVLKLTLGDGNYSWEFVNTNSGGPTDKSTAPVPCHQ